MKRLQLFLNLVCLMALCLFTLSGCGGGGGGSSSGGNGGGGNGGGNQVIPPFNDGTCGWFLDTGEGQHRHHIPGYTDLNVHEEYAFDPEGRETFRSHKRDWAPYGAVDETSTNTRTYVNGLIVKLIESDDQPGAPEITTVYSYDGVGRVSVIDIDIDGDHDGVIDSLIEELFVYTDNTFQFTSKITAEDFDADGTFDYTSTDNYTYNIKSNQVIVTDNWNDGLNQQQTDTTITYDGINWIKREVKGDYNGDGVFDYVTTSTQSYNAEGWPEVHTNESGPGNGVIANNSETTYTYNWSAMTTQMVTNFYDNGTLTKTETYNYVLQEICSSGLVYQMDSDQHEVGTPFYNIH